MLGSSVSSLDALVDSHLHRVRQRTGFLPAPPRAVAAHSGRVGKVTSPSARLRFTLDPQGDANADNVVDLRDVSLRGSKSDVLFSATMDDRRHDAHIDLHLQVKVSVVIPTLNEEANLRLLLPQLPQGLHQVILVDGYSTDNTVEVARSLYPGIEVVKQSRRGKGNALAHGFAACTGDIIVMLDADGSADPAELAWYITALLNGADFVKGSRYISGGGSADLTPIRKLGNSALNFFVNRLYGTTFTDLCYGYNVFWRHCLDHLGLDSLATPDAERVWGDGFEIETMIATRVAKAGLRVVEVPSFEHARVHGESKLNTFGDGVRVMRTAVHERIFHHA